MAASNELHENNDDPKEMVKKMAMIFDILIISAQSAGGVTNVFKDILDVLECEGKLLVNQQLKKSVLLSKERSMLLQHLLSVSTKVPYRISVLTTFAFDYRISEIYLP